MAVLFGVIAVIVFLGEGAHGTELGSPDAERPLNELGDQSVQGSEISVEDLVTIRDVRTLSVSPDGEWVAVQVDRADIAANAFRTGWYVMSTKSRTADLRYVDNAGQARVFRNPQGNLHGNIVGWPAHWSNDGLWLAYLKADDKHGIQVWRVSRDGGAPERLTANAADVIDFAWSADGAGIHYIVGRERAHVSARLTEERRRGFLFNERIDPNLGATPLWPRCEPKGYRFSLLSLGGNQNPCEPAEWYYDLVSKIETSVEDGALSGYWDRRQFDSIEALWEGSEVRAVTRQRAGQFVAWLQNLRPDTYTGYAPPLTVSVSRELSAENAIHCPDETCTGRIENLWWRNETGEIVYQRFEGHRNSVNALYAWRPGQHKARSIIGTDGSFRQCDLVADQLICLYETWTHPSRVASVDLDNGAISILFDPNPSFSSFNFSRIEKIEWTGPGGEQALGHLIYPYEYVEDLSYPLVVVGYSCAGPFTGSFLRGGTGDELPIHVLAQHGIAVLCYTRTSLPEKTSQKVKDWAEYSKSFITSSPLAALEQIIERIGNSRMLRIDRIGISGLSNGAVLVADAMVNSDRFDVASAAWSLDHPARYYLLHPQSMRQLVKSAGGDDPLGNGLEYWSRNSPGVNAISTDTPLLLQVSDTEIFLTLANYLGLEDAGKPVEMYVFPDEYHIKWQPAHKYAVYKRNLQWFKFWLQGVEEPDALDAEQYVRWRKLRDDHCANLNDEGIEDLPVYCFG